MMLQLRPSIPNNTSADQIAPLLREHSIRSVLPAQIKTSQEIHTNTDSPSLSEARALPEQAIKVHDLWNELCYLFRAPPFAYVTSSEDIQIELTTTEQRPSPEWQPEIERRIDELLEFEENWDSYGAPPISPSAAAAAKSTLQLAAGQNILWPSVVPSSDGGVQIEWNLAKVALEIEFRPDGGIGALFVDRTTGIEIEKPRLSAEDLPAWIAALSSC